MFPFKAALNASTLFPFALGVTQQVQVAGQAGFAGVELWVKDILAYLERGGTTAELRAQIEQSGVALVNAIAFFAWADADEAARERAFAQAEREMQILAEIGCEAVAAPPFGDVARSEPHAIAGHFARLHALGRRVGVEPLLEFWGRAPQLSTLSQAVFVALESGLPDARLLIDPFHMYTGGSAVGGLRYLSGAAIGLVHVNDYPADPPRAQIADSDRVFPGEGVGPTGELARLLHAAGYRGYLSLELFIQDFGADDALAVARRGLAAVQAAYQVE
jgi:sugar phosphate isomerase/epimerase